MTRDKAIETMDLLASQGYATTLTAAPTPKGMVPVNGQEIQYSVDVRALSFDKIDLRHLCEQADELGLGCYAGRLGEGSITFAEPDTTPAVVRSPRQHPQ